MAERVGNLGYIAFATESPSAQGTAVTPTVFAFLDNESLTTDYELEQQMPIAGMPYETYQVLPGLRKHTGDIEIVAEPNTAAQLFDMLMTRGTSSGNAPTVTWPFSISNSGGPINSKTIDVSTGNLIKRFVGCQASKITPSFSKNQLMLKASISALGSFQGAVILSTPTGTGPYTIVFDPSYDTNPTSKLVVGDLVRFYDTGTSAAVADGVVASIVNATSVTVTISTGAMTAIGTGDIMYLRPAAINYNVQTPFLWSNTQFLFAATAATALTGTQLRVEQGSSWELDYSFENDAGSQRSGSADPASLPRLTAKSSLNIKKFFDTPVDVINFNQVNKTACVIRHYAYAGANTYELRITLNSIVTNDPLPKIKAKAINYSDIKYLTQVSAADQQQYGVTIVNSLTTIG